MTWNLRHNNSITQPGESTHAIWTINVMHYEKSEICHAIQELPQAIRYQIQSQRCYGVLMWQRHIELVLQGRVKCLEILTCSKTSS